MTSKISICFKYDWAPTERAENIKAPKSDAETTIAWHILHRYRSAAAAQERDGGQQQGRAVECRLETLTISFVLRNKSVETKRHAHQKTDILVLAAQGDTAICLNACL